MRLCKYCNKPIVEKDIWNPDDDGNGYHHQCLIDMEFKARDKQIYDKGKTDMLDKIRAEIKEVYNDRPHSYNHSQRTELFCKVMRILDKYKAESEV